MTTQPRLDPNQAALMVIDIQGRLAELMCNADSFEQEAARMIRGARLFELPVFWMEQIPEKLGPTRETVAQALEGLSPIPKTTFSAWENDEARRRLQSSGRKQVLLVGIEAHVCVWQTARDLLDQGYAVWAVSDAISARQSSNRELGLMRMKEAGVQLTSVEMALFEMQKQADTSDRFKAMVNLFR
ncbi:hydrolase [Mangrovitalea sediminis]|uniref:hydrolase n=1 Tax=Mangrovitalea sediminis TaxID=1982043 RepID=UPI000BE5A110|nr:hydrolase [Mangrovitalea sediminis]